MISGIAGVFILIGLELQAIPLVELKRNIPGIAIGIGIVLAARGIVVYPLFFGIRQLRFVNHYPANWSHILFWGGLRGSIPIALLLGLPQHPLIDPYRTTLSVIVFGVVCFSLVVQGLTMKPLISLSNLFETLHDDLEDPAHHQ